VEGPGPSQPCHMLDEILVKGTLDSDLLKGWEITNPPPIIKKDQL
jgi:hypothetical protein